MDPDLFVKALTAVVVTVSGFDLLFAFMMRTQKEATDAHD